MRASLRVILTRGRKAPLYKELKKTSAATIDQISNGADNQQRDNDDGGDGRRDHLYDLERLAQEGQHPTRP